MTYGKHGFAEVFKSIELDIDLKIILFGSLK